MILFQNLVDYKKRLKISFIGALLVFILYVPVLIFYRASNNDPFDIYNLFMLPGDFIKICLFFGGLIFLATSLTLVNSENSKRIFIQVSISAVIVFFPGVVLLHDIRRSKLYYSSKNKSLDFAEVYVLYKKAVSRKDIRAIVTLANHKNLPDSLVLLFSESQSVGVRRSLAAGQSDSIILVKLSKDISWEVRMCVAMNKSVPLYIIDSLQNDSNERVRKTAIMYYKIRTSK